MAQGPQMTEEQIQRLVEAMAQMSTIPDEQGLSMRELGMGTDLAQTPGAEGTKLGYTYVASSPLEHLAVALNRYRGIRDQQSAKQQMLDTFGRQRTGREQYGTAALGIGGWPPQSIPSSGTGGEF
jgi:hypothetical protein